VVCYPIKNYLPSWKISQEKKTWKKAVAPVVVFGILFFLGVDFWAWGSAEPLIWGFPWWIWYFVGLNTLVVGAMAWFLVDKNPSPKK